MRVGILIQYESDFEAKVKKVRSLGFVSGQVSFWDMTVYNEETAAKIKAICQENGFEITAIWCGWSGPVDWTYPGMYATLGLVPKWLRNQRMVDLLNGAAFGRMLGIKDIVTHIGYIPDNPFDEDYIGITQALKVIGTELKKHGQRLLFETGEELPVTLNQMMNATGLDNLGVNFDPANLTTSGRARAVDALRALSPRLMGMHAKDGLPPQGMSPHGEEVPIGQGAADFPELIKILKSIGYDGDITIEREGVDDATWENDIAPAKAFLETLL
jgi:sugar phosphate isomerase/epimerase